jgi:Uma2 family endonuclease
VVEILSQSNSRADIESKLADYARIGVRECWLVAPQGRTVEVLELDAAEWRRLSIRGRRGCGDNGPGGTGTGRF